MAVQWDAMAAMVAVLAIPLMLSAQATNVFIYLSRSFQRISYRYGSTCERLEWRDVPDGPLSEDAIAKDWSTSDHRPIPRFLHDERQCLDSSIGQIFAKAWVSSHRRNKRVPKPFALDPKRNYVRIDRQVLEAYLLLSHARAPHFREVDGVLTAHLDPSLDTRSTRRSHGSQLHRRTKAEVAKLLEGYPPFYIETIDITSTMRIESPIKTERDIVRGGWVLGLALDSRRVPPTTSYNMDPNYKPPAGWIPGTKINTANNNYSWMSTSMGHAVLRVAHAIEKLQNLFPHDGRVAYVKHVYEKLVQDPSFQTWSNPFLLRYEYEQRLSGSSIVREDPDGWFEYRSQLSKEEWQIAIAAFNHSRPFSEEERHLFACPDRRKAVLHATLEGLLRLFTYGHYDFASREYGSLPDLVELSGHRHIYLEACSPAEEEENT